MKTGSTFCVLCVYNHDVALLDGENDQVSAWLCGITDVD